MKNLTSLISRWKIEYFKIGSIRSILFLNQEIFFTKKGFEHLLVKHGHNRNIINQTRRLLLLKHAIYILQDVNADIEYRHNNKGKNIMHFWGVTSIINDRKIKVVIQKTNSDDRLIFLSIMDHK